MPREIPTQIVDYVERLDSYPECEIVFGLTYAVGTDYLPVQACIEKTLLRFGYKQALLKSAN